MAKLRITPEKMRARREALPTRLRPLDILAGRLGVNAGTLSRWETAKATPHRVWVVLWDQALRGLETEAG